MSLCFKTIFRDRAWLSRHVTPEFPQSNLLRTVFQVVCEKFVQHRPVCSLQISRKWSHITNKSRDLIQFGTCHFRLCNSPIKCFPRSEGYWKTFRQYARPLEELVSTLIAQGHSKLCVGREDSITKSRQNLEGKGQRCHDSWDSWSHGNFTLSNLSRLHSERRQIKGYWWILSWQDLRNNSWFPAARFLLSRSSYVIHH